jgi:hypothetical protein
LPGVHRAPREEQPDRARRTFVPAPSATPRSKIIEMTLCIVVLVTMLAAVLYAAWIGISNYSDIGV